MRRWRWYSKLALALAIAAFAFFVWPTQWRYFRSEGTQAREHRLTHRTYYYELTEGWVNDDRGKPSATSPPLNRKR